MAWYDQSGNNKDTVLSSRIRLARNLEEYPFEPYLSGEQATEIINSVAPLFEKGGFERLDFMDIDPMKAGMLLEKHYVSRDFLNKKSPHTLMLSESMGIAVMLCEEDHLRIQSILPGLSLDEAFRNACAVDDFLSGEVKIAYSEDLGYLTHCPTNLGTAMRASVMMFLPALTMAGKIDSLASRLSKIGLTMRGFYGEGTRAEGALYQISNQITLGITEEDILQKLTDAVKQITESEHE
ncbi:MAG: ATP--guanido phosphotransferase, partial [Clostridia bacterium]|nr:ATP--guanido phosphotransferase [Clostridia bacterium]